MAEATTNPEIDERRKEDLKRIVEIEAMLLLLLRGSARSVARIDDPVRRADTLFGLAQSAIKTAWETATQSSLEASRQQLLEAVGSSSAGLSPAARVQLEELANASAARGGHGISQRMLAGELGQGGKLGLNLEGVAASEASEAYSRARDGFVDSLPPKLRDELWLRRDTAGDKRVCERCERYDGQTAPASVGIEPPAPLHAKCRCTDTLISAAEAAESSGRTAALEPTPKPTPEPKAQAAARPNAATQATRTAQTRRAQPAPTKRRPGPSPKQQRAKRDARDAKLAEAQAKAAQSKAERAQKRAVELEKKARVAAVNASREARLQAPPVAPKPPVKAVAPKPPAKAVARPAPVQTIASKSPPKAQPKPAATPKPLPTPKVEQARVGASDPLAQQHLSKLDEQRAELERKLASVKARVASGKPDQWNVIGTTEKQLAELAERREAIEQAVALRARLTETSNVGDAIKARLLDREQRTAVSVFTGNSYSAIRAAQTNRLGGLLDASEAKIFETQGKAIEAAIADNVKYRGELWRGIRVDQEVAEKLLSATELDWLGSTTSTSRSVAKAREFAGTGGSGDAVGIVFRVRNGKGLAIEDLGMHTEQEVLMSGASRFRVLSKTQQDGRWTIELEQID